MMADVHELNPERTPARRKESSNGGGNGKDLRERVSALETELKHLATKNDVSGLKIWILSGVIGGMTLAVLVALAIVRLIFLTPA